MDACSACFSPELRDLFTPDSLAVALQQLVELVRLPVLFMRTVIQTATVAPKLHSFILELLSKLVLKQVWKTDTKLWQAARAAQLSGLPATASCAAQGSAGTVA
jgi:symplekin